VDYSATDQEQQEFCKSSQRGNGRSKKAIKTNKTAKKYKIKKRLRKGDGSLGNGVNNLE
jgi:hypothetical protein